MRILIVEPFLVESHQAWAEGYAAHSGHEVKILGLQGSHWKWRMHGGAITMADRYRQLKWKPDLILASDMLDLGLFASLLREEIQGVKLALYFHENQLTYPWSVEDTDRQNGTDLHYSFINYSSALVADTVFFNSHFHRKSFLEALPGFLNIYPDHKNTTTAEEIEAKSEVLPLGLELEVMDKLRTEVAKEEPPQRAVILWNHRWEYDKGPDEFFKALLELQNRGVEFKLVVLGRQFGRSPDIFEEAQQLFEKELLHFGFADDREDYWKWLLRSDILPVTSMQDYFGISVVEAMYADVFPLLPKRLAYPEHIPESFHPTFFYDDHRDLVNRLQRLVFDVRVIRKQQTAHFVKGYDWGKMTLIYDERLEAI
jgi:glycosyltransferase involved in cell wall biosynthesis